MIQVNSVCVFCASSERVEPTYRTLAAQLGEEVAARGWALVYGGGNVGLMGEVARGALRSGGRVTGVIPHRLASREIALREVTELVLVDTMRERKALIDERSDAFIVLPGGIGTLEELVEMLTLRMLGYSEKPVVLLDPDGFWRPLEQMLRLMIERELAPEGLLELYAVTTDVAGALAAVQRSPVIRRPATVQTEVEVLESPPT
jgi:uncharacterized protein (TIGR00730 family)